MAWMGGMGCINAINNTLVGMLVVFRKYTYINTYKPIMHMPILKYQKVHNMTRIILPNGMWYSLNCSITLIRCFLKLVIRKWKLFIIYLIWHKWLSYEIFTLALHKIVQVQRYLLITTVIVNVICKIETNININPIDLAF